MNWVRFCGYVLYALILAAAALYVVHRQPDHVDYYTTKNRLPVNHLIRAEDLAGQATPIVGSYARGYIEAGEDVSVKSFAPVPLVPGDRVTMLVPVAPALLGGMIDAGSTVRICAMGKVVTTARAVAGLCRTTVSDTCALIVDFDGTQRPELVVPGQGSKTAFRAVAESATCP